MQKHQITTISLFNFFLLLHIQVLPLKFPHCCFWRKHNHTHTDKRNRAIANNQNGWVFVGIFDWPKLFVKLWSCQKEIGDHGDRRDKATTNRLSEWLGARRDFWLAPNYSSIMKLSKRKNSSNFFLRPFSFPENVLPPATLL